MNGCRRSDGFTLIEVLVAMAILVIVIASTLAIFRASATSWSKGQLRAQRYQQARFILQRMAREISSMVPSSLAGPYCLGMADKLYFVSSASSLSVSLMEIGYWLNEDTQELRRSYQSLPDYDFSTFEQEEPLSENVSQLNFQYYDEVNWYDFWDSRPGASQSGILPKAVKIDFSIRDERTDQEESFSTVVTIPTAQE